MSDGPNEGAFFHPKFVRGDREGCLSIRRNQFEGDRRQSKQRTKNLLQKSRIQEAAKTTSLNSLSGQSSDDGILLVSSSTTTSCSGGFTSTTSMQSLAPGGVPPFDNSGEPFKAALTIFDNVFNLIDDDGSCDTPSRKSTCSAPPKAQQSLGPYSQSRRQLATLLSRKKNRQEPMIITPSHLTVNRFLPMGGLSCDNACTVNHSITFQSNSIPINTTMDTCGTGDDNWLEKLEVCLGESHLMGVEEDGSNNMMGSFDFSPRPIEEMCHHCDESHVSPL